MDKNETLAFIAGSLAVIAVCALIFGMTVYNHMQDVSLNKYYADHCKLVKQDYNANTVIPTNTWSCTK